MTESTRPEFKYIRDKWHGHFKQRNLVPYIFLRLSSIKFRLQCPMLYVHMTLVATICAIFLFSKTVHGQNFENALDDYERGHYKEAIKQLEELTKIGNPKAHFLLGYMFEFGQGVEINVTKAMEFYKSAANFGIQEAVNRLSDLEMFE